MEGKVDDLKFELEEERTILQATQDNLEEQLRVNNQLEIEITRLRQNASQVAIAFSVCISLTHM